MNISLEMLKSIKNAITVLNSYSLNTKLSSDNDDEILDIIKDKNAETYEELIQKKFLSSDIKTIIKKVLKPRQETIIKLLYRFEDGEKKTLDYVAKKFGISRERVRQIGVRALYKLRNYIKENNIDI